VGRRLETPPVRGALSFWSRPWLHTALDRREGCREAPSPAWCSEWSGWLLLWRAWSVW
jgi:hypothetical protein